MLNSVRHGAAVLGSLAEVAVRRYMSKASKHSEGGDDDVSVSVHDLFSHVDAGLLSGSLDGGATQENRSIAAGLSRPSHMDGFAKGSPTRVLGRFAERPRLFSASELKTLANAIAATRATGELLGRSRIRLRQQAARTRKHAENFTESPTDFTCFASSGGLHPMAPLQAVKYFTGLVPQLKVNANFVAGVEHEAFTFAEGADEVLIGRVQDAIADVLKTGKGGAKDVEAVLDQAGVSSSNPSYPELIFRTNAMDAYRVGSAKEMQDPDVAEDFPAWQYSAIVDNRVRETHAERDGNYYPNDTTLMDVRDAEGYDGFFCRCDAIPVFIDDWKELQASGEDFS